MDELPRLLSTCKRKPVKYTNGHVCVAWGSGNGSSAKGGLTGGLWGRTARLQQQLSKFRASIYHPAMPYHLFILHFHDRPCFPDCQLVALRDVRKEGRDGDEDRSARPDQREADRVDARCARPSASTRMHPIWPLMSAPLTIHSISTLRASMTRWIQRSSHAKNLMNLTCPRNLRYQ